jgi:hypothetical protein
MTITWRYSISVGLSGCYMPNTISGPYIGNTRKELAATIRDQIGMYADQEDDPSERSLFAQVRINNLWHHIKRHGSSVAHFSIDIGRGEEIAFHGLTEDEANQMERENGE